MTASLSISLLVEILEPDRNARGFKNVISKRSATLEGFVRIRGFRSWKKL